jgi:hypothetical protein
MLVGVRVPEARGVMLRAAGVSALAWAAWVAACFAWKPARPRLDSLPAFVAITVAGLALAWTALLAPTIGAPIALGVVVVAGFTAWRGVPAVMELHGAEAPAGRAHEERGAAPTRRPASSLRAWIAWRTCLLGRNVALLAATAFLTFLLVGDDGPMRAEPFLAIFFTGMVVMHSTRVLRDVGHLPIARRRLAAWVLLPPLLAMGLGFLGALAAWELDPGTHWAQQVDLAKQRRAGESKDAASDHVMVPGALLRPVLFPARRSGSFVVTAPWGESATLRFEPLLPGLPLAFANPYDITPESSIDFVAWQLSRAVRDAYGAEVAPEEIRERYLSVLQGRVIGPFFDQRFGEDHPEIDHVDRPGAVGWSLGLLVLVWLVAGWWGTGAGVPPADRIRWERSRRWVRTLQITGGLVVLGLVFGPSAWHRRLPGVEDSLAAALVRAVGGSEWVIPVAALVLAAAGYAWLARRFERMEVPPALQRTWIQAPE